jgi:hypothetical protein
MTETYKDKIMKSTTKQIEFNKFVEYLDLLDTCIYKCEAQKIINLALVHTDDDAQINTLKRIFNNKSINISPKYIDKNICPHCSKKNLINQNDDYVICGYTHKGYDWNGCGKDWCNNCSKKLCKQWGTDSLFNKLNRIHTNKCCRKHAEKMGADYLMEYCQCTGKYYKMDKYYGDGGLRYLYLNP